MEVSLKSLLPEWVTTAETQAVMILGVCCVGAWITFKCLMQVIVKIFTVLVTFITQCFQIVFSILWPLFAVVALTITMPSVRKVVLQEFLPKQCRLMSTLKSCFATGQQIKTLTSRQKKQEFVVTIQQKKTIKPISCRFQQLPFIWRKI